MMKRRFKNLLLFAAPPSACWQGVAAQHTLGFTAGYGMASGRFDPKQEMKGMWGTIPRRPFMALLWCATLRGRFRYRPRIPATGFLVRAQRLAGRGEEGFPLLFAPYQFGCVAGRLAAPRLYTAQPHARLPRGCGHLLPSFSSDYEDESAKASGMTDWKGNYNYKTARVTAAGATGLRAAAVSPS